MSPSPSQLFILFYTNVCHKFQIISVRMGELVKYFTCLEVGDRDSVLAISMCFHPNVTILLRSSMFSLLFLGINFFVKLEHSGICRTEQLSSLTVYVRVLSSREAENLSLHPTWTCNSSGVHLSLQRGMHFQWSCQQELNRLKLFKKLDRFFCLFLLLFSFALFYCFCCSCLDLFLFSKLLDFFCL